MGDRLIGVPIADRERFRRLSVAYTETFDPTIAGERRDRAIRDSVELFDYVRALAVDRDRAPGEDLLSTLVRAEEDGTKLDMDELVACVCMLLVAGNETTADLIATGLALLLVHPEQLDVLRARPELIDSALHEVLRYEAPLQFSPRIATEAVALDGRVIPRALACSSATARATATPASSTVPSSSTSPATTRATSPSPPARTSASATSSRSPRAASSSPACSSAFPSIDLTGKPAHRTDRFFQHGCASVPITVST